MSITGGNKYKIYPPGTKVKFRKDFMPDDPRVNNWRKKIWTVSDDKVMFSSNDTYKVYLNGPTHASGTSEAFELANPIWLENKDTPCSK